MIDRKILTGCLPLLLTSAVTLYLARENVFPDETSDVQQQTRILEAVEYVEDMDPSLLPLSMRDVIAFCLATCGLMIAAGGGIGGGGILVPIYILVLNFTPKQAIPLSNVTVFGGALANLLLNYSKRHPVANRPLIDWDLILVMEPMTLVGALVGANLNMLLPDLAILLSLVILLTLTGYKTYHKAVKLHRQEVQGWHAVKTAPEEDSTEETTSDSLDIEMSVMEIPPPPLSWKRAQSDPFVSIHSVGKNKSGQRQRRSFAGSDTIVSLSLHRSISIISTTGETEESKESFELEDVDGIALVELSTQKTLPNSLREQILQEEKQPRLQSILVIASLFAFVLLVNILKGGGALASPLGIQCGSAAFWLLEGLIVVATLAATLYARSYLLRQGRRKAQADYKYLETDIKWNQESTLLYPAICTGAGMIAGLFGVGGGLVKAPLLLALGVHPAVASATSATMILFTTFTATTSFVAFGMLVWDYGLVCLVIGFLATFLGQVVMNSLIQRTGKSSYIAFCIAGVVIVSAITMTAEWIYALSTTGGHDDERHAGFCGQE